MLSVDFRRTVGKDLKTLFLKNILFPFGALFLKVSSKFSRTLQKNDLAKNNFMLIRVMTSYIVPFIKRNIGMLHQNVDRIIY